MTFDGEGNQKKHDSTDANDVRHPGKRTGHVAGVRPDKADNRPHDEQNDHRGQPVENPPGGDGSDRSLVGSFHQPKHQDLLKGVTLDVESPFRFPTNHIWVLPAATRAPEDDRPHELAAAILPDHRDHRSLRPRLADEVLDLALAALEPSQLAVLQLEDEADEVAEVVVDDASAMSDWGVTSADVLLAR
jgi:hypothetical protein